MKRVYLSLLNLILIGLVSEALAFPPLPHTFYGTVKKDGINVPDGTVIGAWIGGGQCGSATTFTFGADSVYTFNILGDDPETLPKEGGVNGDTVSFTIGSDTAVQKDVFLSGSLTNLSLTVTTVQTLTISGYVRTSGGVGISGVLMNGLPGNPSTDGDGTYTGSVDYGWTGVVTPTKAGYTFSPASTPYSNLTSHQSQNYTRTDQGSPPTLVDFDGDGKTDIAVYRKSTGTWYLDLNGNRVWDGPGVDAVIGWGGDPSDTPVVGDWNGSGTAKIGVYRGSTGTWYLDLNGNRVWDGPGVDAVIGWDGPGVDAVIGWGGDPSDTPVVGDWNGSGTAKIGVYRGSTGTWYLDLNGNQMWDGCGTDTCIGWGGDQSDTPVVGDWNGSGTAKIGVYRGSTGTWYLDLNGNRVWDGLGVDVVIGWGGDQSDMPVVGDWNGSGTAKIGVYRESTGSWYLDLNGNQMWDGCGTDACIGWGGDPSDEPVVGTP